jgi:hypothetical protein
MSCDKYARMIIKQGSGIPTVPASPDHRDGSWLNTDIYEGEQYLDTDTGIVYTRNGSSIVPVSSGGIVLGRAVISVTQTSTNAPVITEHFNTIGALGSFYNNVGQFNITSSGLFTLGKTEVISQYMVGNRKYAECNIAEIDPTDSIILNSLDAAYTLANGILENYFIEIIIWA